MRLISVILLKCRPVLSGVERRERGEGRADCVSVEEVVRSEVTAVWTMPPLT